MATLTREQLLQRHGDAEIKIVSTPQIEDTTPEEKTGLFKRIGRGLRETGGDIREIGEGIGEGFQEAGDRMRQEFREGTTIDPETGDFQQSKASTLLQQFGAGAKAVGGAIGETVLGLGKAILPQRTEEKIAEAVPEAIETVSESFIGDAARSLRDDFLDNSNVIGTDKTVREFIADLTPNQKDNLRAVGEIVLLGADIAGGAIGTKAATTAGKVATRAGKEALETSAELVGVGVRGTQQAAEAVARGTRGATQAIGEVTPKLGTIRDRAVVRALELNAGDVQRIEKATGNEVPRFLLDNQLVANSVAETADLIEDFRLDNMKIVRDSISKVDSVYTDEVLPAYQKLLKAVRNDVDGVAGLEDQLSRIDNLLQKKQFVLNDVQAAKEIFDEVESVFKRSGETKAGFKSQGLANLRRNLKEFIEVEVKKVDPDVDIKKLNNNVATSKSIEDLIDIRDTRPFTRSNLSIGDFATFGTVGGAGAALLGPFSLPAGMLAVFAKKMTETAAFRLRLAKFLEGISKRRANKIRREIQTGQLSDETAEITAEIIQDILPPTN